MPDVQGGRMTDSMGYRSHGGLKGRPSGGHGARPARPCSARRSNGMPCRNYAIIGGTVCSTHGGRAPQVRRAAERRWIEAQIEMRLAVDLSLIHI